MAEQHNINLDLKFDPARQYYFRVSASEFEERPVPDVLINIFRKKNIIECQTLPLMKMNQKIKDAHNEVISMSDKSVQELIDAVRSQINPLFKISESLALLDMLSGMAQLVTTQDYVQPDLTTSTLALKSSRHPILDKLFLSHCTTTKLIPNDVYSTPQHRFQIITGANMSGKSTYIRSIALNTLLAQSGCFVPAQYASFPIFHQLFALLATDSNVEANVSSFASEMSSIAFILRNIEPRSLVIVDELGRGTSTTDGLGIAIAIAEALIKSKAFVWFVTHFHDLPRILAERAGVVNLHLNIDITPNTRDSRRRRTGSATASTETGSNNADSELVLPTKMKMTYRIASGPLPTSCQYYGLTLARTISLPADVIDVATQVSRALHERNEARKSNRRAAAVARRRKLLLGLKEQLRQARESAGMDQDGLRAWLKKLQDEFIVRLGVINGEADADEGNGEMMGEEGNDEVGLDGMSVDADAEGAMPGMQAGRQDAPVDLQVTQDTSAMGLRDNPTRNEHTHGPGVAEEEKDCNEEHHRQRARVQNTPNRSQHSNTPLEIPWKIKTEKYHPAHVHRPITSASGSLSIVSGAEDEWTAARVQNEREYREEMEGRKAARR